MTIGSKRAFDALVHTASDSTRSATHSSRDNLTTPTTTSRSIFDTNSNDDDVFATHKTTTHHRSVKRKPASTATIELRQLREEKAMLQHDLDTLQHKWRRLGVDSDLLACACDAALAKRNARRAETINKQLKAQLLTQQLFFASATQMMLVDSPLLQQLRAKDAFDAIHTPLQLAADTSQRAEQLERHCASALRLAPAMMHRLTHMHVDKATAAVPFSHISVTGDAAHTFVASVLVCKLQHLTVERVHDAALAYADALPAEFKRCLGIDVKVDADVDAPGFASSERLARRSLERTRYRNATSGVSATQTTVTAAHVRDDRSVVVSDFAELGASSGTPSSDSDSDTAALATCSSLVLSTVVDAASNERVVLLQRVIVHRYALPATSRRLHDDIQSLRPHLNGDLLIAVLCRELQQQSSSRNVAATASPTELI